MKCRIYLFAFLLLGQISRAQEKGVFEGETMPCIDKIFQVNVIHVLDSTGGTGLNGNATDAIDYLNQVFLPICIQFKVCSFQSIPFYQFDTLDHVNEAIELDKRFHEYRKLNIYLVSKVRIKEEENHSGFLLPVVNDQFEQGGIFVEKSTMNSSQGAHIFGHLLGLSDTWNVNLIELVNGSNCTKAGDHLCSTPADPFDPQFKINEYITKDCKFNKKILDPNGDIYKPDVTNVMSPYVKCRCTFTKEQYRKMAAYCKNNLMNFW